MSNRVHWKETQGSKFLVRPHADMCLKESFLRTRNCSVRGQSKYRHARESLIQVEYDREYVVCWLAYQLSALADLPYNELQKLISEAREQIKAANKQKNLGASSDRQD